MYFLHRSMNSGTIFAAWGWISMNGFAARERAEAASGEPRERERAVSTFNNCSIRRARAITQACERDGQSALRTAQTPANCWCGERAQALSGRRWLICWYASLSCTHLSQSTHTHTHSHTATPLCRRRLRSFCATQRFAAFEIYLALAKRRRLIGFWPLPASLPAAASQCVALKISKNQSHLLFFAWVAALLSLAFAFRRTFTGCVDFAASPKSPFLFWALFTCPSAFAQRIRPAFCSHTDTHTNK